MNTNFLNNIMDEMSVHMAYDAINRADINHRDQLQSLAEAVRKVLDKSVDKSVDKPTEEEMYMERLGICQ